jgi:hypothetical protein
MYILKTICDYAYTVDGLEESTNKILKKIQADRVVEVKIKPFHINEGGPVQFLIMVIHKTVKNAVNT